MDAKNNLFLFVSIALVVFIFGSPCAAAHGVDLEDPRPRPPQIATCVAVSRTCQVCDDNSKHKLDSGGKVVGLYKSDDYYCASVDRRLSVLKIKIGTRSCLKLSSFCAICDDRRFYSMESKNEIASDLYECSTRPRVNRQPVLKGD